jgi:ADP-ribose pyrophosphatase YjhB (NUDIX family)
MMRLALALLGWAFPLAAAGRGVYRRIVRPITVEETGCQVEAERLLGMYSTRHQGMTNHVAVYVCRPLSPPRPRLNIEIAEARYWPLDALPPSAHRMVQQRLSEYAAGVQGLDGSL